MHDSTLVPPHSDDTFPHQTYPPWQSLMRVLGLLADVLAAHDEPSLRAVEVRLFQAARQIVALARGDLALATWHRRLCVAVDRLEQSKDGLAAALVARRITVDEACIVGDAVDDTIARLGEAGARLPLPDEASYGDA